MKYLEEKVKEVPNVEKPLTIKGVGMSIVIGFITEVGDIGSKGDVETCRTGDSQAKFW